MKYILLVIALSSFVGFSSMSEGDRVSTNVISRHQPCRDIAFIPATECTPMHNGDYDLATPDSLAFDDVCFFEDKYYLNKYIDGYLKYTKNNKNYYVDALYGQTNDSSTAKRFGMDSGEWAHYFDYLSYSYSMVSDIKNLVKGKILPIIIDSNFQFKNTIFYNTREFGELGSPNAEGYIPYNAAEKPNFIRIVSYDPKTKILKARFRITFQVINVYKGKIWIGPTIEGIGKKRYANSPDFITLDDGVIHGVLLKYF